MNEIPARASALLFARALNKAFFGSKNDSAILIPRVGQTALYADPAVSYLEKRKCRIDLNSEVRSLVMKGDSLTGVELANGTSIKSGSVICAISPHPLAGILPHNLRRANPFRGLGNFESSPIISFHLWFDSIFTDIDYLGCIDLDLQWIFNRRKIFDEPDNRSLYLTAVISGARKYVEMHKSELIRLAIGDIRKIFPESKRAVLQHSVIIKEKRATFSATPAAESFRPGTSTPVHNFFLAGDWTSTGYPATIEGAVMSGFIAAEHALKI